MTVRHLYHRYNCEDAYLSPVPGHGDFDDPPVANWFHILCKQNNWRECLYSYMKELLVCCIVETNHVECLLGGLAQINDNLKIKYS